MTDLDIRESQDSDHAMITDLYPEAFPEEDLLAVVRALLGASEGVLSLVAIKGSEFVGHLAFTDCKIDGAQAKVAMLAPLAVAPAFQRQGVGSALVRGGLLRLREKDVSRVYVLGAPAYYARFGFATETSVAPPYSLPDEWREAWRSTPLHSRAPAYAGRLDVPAFWRDPKLWAP